MGLPACVPACRHRTKVSTYVCSPCFDSKKCFFFLKEPCEPFYLPSLPRLAWPRPSFPFRSTSCPPPAGPQRKVSLQSQPASSVPALSLHEIEASTRAGSASAQQAGVQPAAADEEGKVSNAAAAADAAAPASAAAARQPREVQLDLAGYDEQEAQQYDEEGEVDVENPEEASLLGGHHARELIGLSVFGVFKLVSFFFCVVPCLWWVARRGWLRELSRSERGCCGGAWSRFVDAKRAR